MTDKEKAVVMAYTGCVMLKGSRLKVFYDYVSELIGRPVFTHELEILSQRISEAARTDFIEICRCDTAENEPVRHGQWIHCAGKSNLWYCSECGGKILYNPTRRTYNIKKLPVDEMNRFCRSCGAKMDGGAES